jgi:hypothetical protein
MTIPGKVIGIDPGISTGIAIAINGKLSDLITTNFWGAIDILAQNKDVLVIIELPTTKHVWHGGATSKAAIQRTGVNVGSCLREASLLVEYLEKEAIEYIPMSPQGK